MYTIVIPHDFQIIVNCIVMAKGAKFLKCYFMSEVHDIWQSNMLVNCNISLSLKEPTVSPIKHIRNVEKCMSKKKSDVAPYITYTKRVLTL